MVRPLIIFAVVCVVAIIAGILLGGQSSTPVLPDPLESPAAVEPESGAVEVAPEAAPAVEAEIEVRQQLNASLLVEVINPVSRDAVESEIARALQEGISRIVVPIPLSWDGATRPDMSALVELLATYPEISVIADLSLNPPPTWYESHTTAAVTLENDQVIPNLHADAWSESAANAMDDLIEQFDGEGITERVQGYVLRGLHHGYWITPEGGRYDATEAREAFERWLTLRYDSEEDLVDAWETDDIPAMIAQAPFEAVDSEAPLFPLDGSTWARNDWARFQSEAVVRTIERLSSRLKRAAGRTAKVYVPYGFTLELPGVASGHLALERLLASDVDGLVCPLSERTRAMGQSGVYRIPVSSARYALKDVLFIDDTRTGLDNGAAEDWPFDSIAEVFERNAAAAMAAGLHPVWSDHSGSGALDDERLWRRFGTLGRVQHGLETRVAALGGQFRRYDVRPEGYAALTVVIDEESFYHVNNAAPVLRLIEQVRRAAIEAGVSVHFTLLSDVLADRTASSPVYLFVNAFYVNGSDRDRLPAIMERDKATAIWMYAPGFHDVTYKAKNVSETVLMDIQELESPPKGGSTYQLAGRWIGRDTTYAYEGMPTPLFHIVPGEDISTIATYAGSDRVSVAAVSPGGEWTSVFLADPALPTVLLRELLTILELQPIADPVAENDSFYFANDIIAIHGANDGPRALPLPWQYDVIDDVDKAQANAGYISSEDVVGWTGVRSIVFNLSAGETRIFRLTPNTGTAQ